MRAEHPDESQTAVNRRQAARQSCDRAAQPGQGMKPRDREHPAFLRRSFCLTEMSIAALIVCALGLSAVLWVLILVVL